MATSDPDFRPLEIYKYTERPLFDSLSGLYIFNPLIPRALPQADAVCPVGARGLSSCHSRLTPFFAPVFIKETMSSLSAQASSSIAISLSPDLFWDVRVDDIDLEKHAVWLARRVLEYGDWPDWQKLVRYYGRARLSGIVTEIRSLQPRALAFCKVWFNLPECAFRCSTHPQSL